MSFRKLLSLPQGGPVFLSAMLSVAVFSMLLVLVLYFAKFYGFLSAEHERWGTFGDFLEGS